MFILSIFFFFFGFTLNTYGTLKIFLLSSQTIFVLYYYSYVEGIWKKNSSLNFMSSVDFHVSKIWILFGKFTVEQVLKSLLSRRNSLEPLVLDFPIVFHMIWKNQESWKPWLIGIQSWNELIGIKNAKNSANNFFVCVFELPLWIY